MKKIGDYAEEFEVKWLGGKVVSDTVSYRSTFRIGFTKGAEALYSNIFLGSENVQAIGEIGMRNMLNMLLDEGGVKSEHGMCKDCRHYHQIANQARGICNCESEHNPRARMPVLPTFYCAYYSIDMEKTNAKEMSRL